MQIFSTSWHALHDPILATPDPMAAAASVSPEHVPEEAGAYGHAALSAARSQGGASEYDGGAFGGGFAVHEAVPSIPVPIVGGHLVRAYLLTACFKFSRAAPRARRFACTVAACHSGARAAHAHAARRYPVRCCTAWHDHSLGGSCAVCGSVRGWAVWGRLRPRHERECKLHSHSILGRIDATVQRERDATLQRTTMGQAHDLLHDVAVVDLRRRRLTKSGRRALFRTST